LKELGRIGRRLEYLNGPGSARSPGVA